MRTFARSSFAAVLIVGFAFLGAAAAQGSGAPPVPADDGGAARKACVAAMNADPSFADAIIKTAEVKLADKVNEDQIRKDVCTLNTHQEAQADVAVNERHVILAYIAMWLVAVGFVVFLWRRQLALKLEIVQLQRDLEAATKEAK